MTKIPNNVIKPPPGYEYVQQRSVPLIQPKLIKDDTRERIEYLDKSKEFGTKNVLKKSWKNNNKIEKIIKLLINLIFLIPIFQ